jgi:hypothetical protein
MCHTSCRYKKAKARQGGWRYEREFEVAEKELIAEDTMRLKFKPTDGCVGV